MKVLSKLRNSKFAKYIATTTVAAMIAAIGCINCFATDGDVNVGSILQTAFSSLQSDLLGYIAIILPISLAIFGIYFGIKKAIAFFRSSASKG